MRFRAAVLRELKRPLEVHELEVPALRYGQVLVKLLCSGICGSQLGEIDGVKGEDRFLPHLLGHEATSDVVEIGEGVRHVKPDDRVVMHWRKGAGIDAPAPVYSAAGLGRVNAGWITTFNEYAVVSENRVTRLPRDFDPEVGALMGCAATTGLGVINNNAQVKIGESVVVWGAGGVGLNIVQGAAMVSAHPVIAIDLFDNKLALARELGATHTINAGAQDAEAEVRKILGPAGADVAIDNTGQPRVIEACYRLTGDRGRTILVGVPAKGRETTLYTLPLHFEKWIEGSHGGESRPDIDIPNYVRLHEAGRLRLKPLVSRRYRLDQINEAIQDMRDGAFPGRCMITLG